METKEKGPTFDDVIFEQRNKAYGAYFLRKNYKKHVIFAMCFTLVFLLMSMSTPFIIGYMGPEVIVMADGSGSVEFSPIPPLDDEPEPPVVPEPPPPPANAVSCQLNFAPVVVDEPVDAPPDITDPDIIPGDTSGSYQVNGYDINPEPPDIITEPDVPDDTPLKPFMADEQPEFVGGETEMQKFIRDHAPFPPEIRELNIEGKVYVEFTVTKTGEVTDAKIIRSVDPELDRIALKAVLQMPRWNPGKKDGEPVNISLTLPIVFKLIR